jgi:phospholipid/cholesterol/gamma-HCH transport system substrate-binding protein
MRMDNRKMVIIGVFVFVGALIFVAAVLTLGGQKNTFEKKSTIKAIFSNVGGLKEGNNVWFSGVKIGQVKKMHFTPNALVEVDMNVEDKAMQYIRKDAKARISTEGFIGNKLVEIFGGSMQSPPVQAGDVLAVDNGVGMEEMVSTLQQNNKNLLDITGNIKLITQRLLAGQGTAGRILSDETLANDLQETINRFKMASATVQKITGDVASFTSQLQSQGSLTNELINDTVLTHQLKTTALQIQQASTTIKLASDDIKQMSTQLKNVTDKLSSAQTPAGVLLNDEEAGKNIKIILENLQSGSKKLDEDLEALQHNILFRGFFKKKAKSEAKQ